MITANVPMPFHVALSRLSALPPKLSSERVALDDSADRVLTDDLTSSGDIPSFDYSAMDSYAVQSSDFTGEPPWTLDVRGESRAGGPVSQLKGPNAATRIFTGAGIPDGADAVIMQEKAVRAGDKVTFNANALPSKGQFIRRRGDDIAQGDVAIAKGTRLNAAHVGLAAQLDVQWLYVARRPVVTILGTGDELRNPGSQPRPGSIPDSNGVAIRTMARRANGVVRVAPYVRDDKAETARCIQQALDSSDLVVTIGGVSVGDHDFVQEALKSLGVTIDFWRVAMKPGKPLLVGTRGSSLVLGLPGNPASAMLTFALFGVPLLRLMQGDSNPWPERTRVKLACSIEREPGRMEFARAQFHRAPSPMEGEILATLARNQASGAITSMATSHGVVCIPEDVQSLAKGECLDALMWSALGV